MSDTFTNNTRGVGNGTNGYAFPDRKYTETCFDGVVQLLKGEITSKLGLPGDLELTISEGSAYANLDSIHRKLLIGGTWLHAKQGVVSISRPLYKGDEASFGIVKESPYLICLSTKGLAPRVIAVGNISNGDDVIVMENFPENLREYTARSKADVKKDLSEMIKRFQLETCGMFEKNEFEPEYLFKNCSSTPFDTGLLLRKLSLWTDLFKIYKYVINTKPGDEKIQLFLEPEKTSIFALMLAGIRMQREKQEISGFDMVLKPIVDEFVSSKHIPAHFDLRAQNILCKADNNKLILVPCDYQRARKAVGLWDPSVAFCDPAIGCNLEEVVYKLDEHMTFLIQNKMMVITDESKRPLHLLAAIIFGSAFNVGKALEQRTNPERYKKFLTNNSGQEDNRYKIDRLMNDTLDGLLRVCSTKPFTGVDGIENIKREIEELKEELENIVELPPVDREKLKEGTREEKIGTFSNTFSFLKRRKKIKV